MSIRVSRTVVEVTSDRPEDDRIERPIEHYEDCGAFVLLGEAGAGKSTEFRRAAQEAGNGQYVTVRDFLALGVRPEWRHKTLFIDALDERRAGSPDRRTPLDQIRSRLERLGRPRFRISCRSLDWLGLNDQRHLGAVSPDERVRVLHLSPLGERDVMAILRESTATAEPQEFVRTADANGLGALLENPLTLRLLARSVAELEWPRTRTETYLRASRILAMERNEEHRLSTRPQFSDEEKLRAAGRLFAMKILTGSEGYGDSADGGESFLSSGDAQAGDPHLVDVSLRSGLFRLGESGQHVPFHEAVAEFLAGRFLAGQVDAGLPIGRILSLMTGYDGVTLPQFRTVAAWMAAHSLQCRRDLISADPVGAILEGDVASFPTSDKIHILESIDAKCKENPWFITNVQYRDPRLGRLASADLAEYCARTLGLGSRSDAQQVHAFVLLAVLNHGSAIPELSDEILRVVEDGTWWPTVRFEALRVLQGLPPSDGRRQRILLRVLRRIESGEVEDSDDSIRGLLLRNLYPTTIGPEQILDHFRFPKEPHLSGRYVVFWDHWIAELSTAAQVATVMDCVADRFAEVARVLGGRMIGVRPFFSFIPSIALRAILESGDDVGPRRIFRWLEVLARPEVHISPDDQGRVQAWLAARPQLLRGVCQRCVDHCLKQARFAECFYWMEHRLGLDAASDYAQLCLSAASKVENPDAAAWLETHVRASAYLATQAVKDPPPSSPAAEGLTSPGNRDGHSIGRARGEDHSRDPAARNRYREFKDLESALRENRCDPGTLFRLARIYFGESPEHSAGSPDTRLRAALFHDEALVEAARLGLRNAIVREDLPSADDFARMLDESRIHYLALPVLAGLEEIGLDGPVRFRSSAGVCERLALTIHFGVPRMNPDPWRNNPSAADGQPTPAWYARLARDNPAVVAREFVRNARSRLRCGKSLVPHFASLDCEPNLSTIAPSAILAILRMFPVRSGTAQSSALANLLGLARRHCPEAELEALIRKKLRCRSMAVAQRVCWVTAAFLASPRAHSAALERTVAASQVRIRQVAEFLKQSFDDGSQPDLFDRLGATDLRLLVEMVGSWYGPGWHDSQSASVGGASRGPDVSDLMAELIDRLGSCTSKAASEALESTRTDEALRPWWFSLGRAADRQRAIRREAEFKYASAGTVCRVLEGGEPVNPADLAALTADALRKLADNIRNGNTSDWKQYWIRHGDISQWRPHPENDCRDALLSDLRGRLSPLGIDCQPEPHYLDGKRGDIRVACSGYGVPIEIKKSDHPGVWGAIQSQLIPKYTQDRECDGRGIYVVFWLGPEFLQPPPSGPRPAGSAAMRELLLNSLTEDQRRTVWVVVVDVARDRQYVN